MTRICRQYGFVILFTAILSAKGEGDSQRRPLSAQPLAEAPYACLEGGSERLLKRRIDALSATKASVGEIVAVLSAKADLPLSFLQAEPEEFISLNLGRVTVLEALEAIVASAPRYRYGIIADRLVLYPRDPKWEMRLNHVRLGPAPRVQVTRALAREISRRLPAFAKLGGPWVLGDPRAYTYQDLVTVKGPGSVLELLVQLLGSRPSVYFLVVKKEGWVGPSLSVSSRDQLRALRMTASATTLRGHGESVQLKIIGTLDYDGSFTDLTSAACGTIYQVSDERILSVSPSGLLTALGTGEVEVTASNELFSDSITMKVDGADSQQ